MKSLFAACLLLLSLANSFAQQSAQPAVVNGIVAIVNDRVITVKDVYMSVRTEREFLERRYGSQPKVLKERIDALTAEAIESLVENYLVLQEFDSIARPLPESYIDNRINEDMKQAFGGDRLTMMKTLQQEGLTYESYRQKIKDKLTTQILWDAKVPRDPVVSPTRIENYYVENRDKFKLEDRVHLRMIVLTNRADAAISPKQLASEIAKKLDEGAPFSEMAKIYSNGSSAAQGGDMGWVEKKTLREELANVAFSLKPGTRSEPIEVAGTIFLMYAEKAEPAHVRSLSEVREDIENTLKAEDSKRRRKDFVERLKKKAFVRYF